MFVVCRSNSVSTPGKLNDMPGSGGNRTNEL